MQEQRTGLWMIYIHMYVNKSVFLAEQWRGFFVHSFIHSGGSFIEKTIPINSAEMSAKLKWQTETN